MDANFLKKRHGKKGFIHRHIQETCPWWSLIAINFQSTHFSRVLIICYLILRCGKLISLALLIWFSCLIKCRVSIYSLIRAAGKRFLIEVLIDLINYGIHYLFNKNIFSRVIKSWLRGWNLVTNIINKRKLRLFWGWEVQAENLNSVIGISCKFYLRR